MLAVLEAKVQNNNDDISEAEEEDDEANNIVLLNDRSFDSLATTSHRSGRHDRNGSNGVISDPIAKFHADFPSIAIFVIIKDMYF